MNSILRDIQINPQEYKSKFPYPYGAQDNFLEEDLSTFDLDLEHPVSEQTAKELIQVELNVYFHRKFDGKLKKIDRNPGSSVQLTKSNSGYQVVKNHAGLILESGEIYVDTEYYDRIN